MQLDRFGQPAGVRRSSVKGSMRAVIDRERRLVADDRVLSPKRWGSRTTDQAMGASTSRGVGRGPVNAYILEAGPIAL